MTEDRGQKIEERDRKTEVGKIGRWEIEELRD